MPVPELSGNMKLCYLAYVKKHFPGPEETFIIFDGYLQPSTIDMVHGIRNPIASLEIVVAFDNMVDCKNKHKFIGLLMEGLEEGLYHVSQCVADADSYFILLYNKLWNSLRVVISVRWQKIQILLS